MRCGSRSTPTTDRRPPPIRTPSPSRTSPSAACSTWAQNLHAVFFVQPRETLSFHYERGPDDPRVGHEIILADRCVRQRAAQRLDRLSAPRRVRRRRSRRCPATTQAMLAYDQARLHVRGTEQRLHQRRSTTWRLAGRLPGAAAVGDRRPPRSPASPRRSRERGSPTCSPSTRSTGRGRLADGVDRSARRAVRGDPGSDVDGTGTPAAAPTRRFVAQQRVRYRSDDLTALLPPGQLQPRALPGQSYQAALTPGLLSAIFGALVRRGDADRGRLRPAGRRDRLVDAVRPGVLLPRRQRHAGPGAGGRARQFFLPRRAVDPFGAITRADYDGYALLPITRDRPGGKRHDRRQRLPRPAAGHGHRPERQPGLRRVRRARPGHRDRCHGQGDARRSGDLLTGFATDLDDATLIAQFSDPLGRPGRDPGQRHHPLPLRPRRLPADRARPRSRRRRPPTRWPARPTSPTWRTAAYPGAPQATRYQYQLRLLRRLRPGDPAQGPGGAGPGHRGRPGGRAALGRVRLDDLRQQGTAGPQVRAVLLGDERFRVRRADRGQHGPVLRPARPRGGDAASRQQLGEGGLRPVAGAALGRRRHRADRRSARRRRRRRLLPAPARHRALHVLVRPAHRRHLRRDRRRPGGPAGRGAEGRRAPRRRRRSRTGTRSAGPAWPSPTTAAATAIPVRTAYDTRAGRWPSSTRSAGARRSTATAIRSPAAASSTWPAPTWPASPLYHVNADGGARRGLANVAGHPIRSWDARGHAFRVVYDPAQRPTERYVSTGGAPEILIEPVGLRRGPAGGEPVRPAVPALRHGRVRREQPVRLQGQPAGERPAAGRGLPPGRRLDAAGRAHRRRLSSTPPRPRPGWCHPATAAGTGSRAARSYDALNRPIQLVTPHNATMRPDVLQPGYDEAALLEPDGCLAAAGRGAGRAARSGHRRSARRHRHRLQRARPAGLDRAGQRHRLRPTSTTRRPSGWRSLTTTRPGTFAAQPADGPGPGLLLRPGRERHADRRRRGHPGRDLLPQPAGRADGRLHLRPAVPADHGDRPRAPGPDRRRAVSRRSRSPTTTRSAPACRSPATGTRWAPTPRPTATTPWATSSPWRTGSAPAGWTRRYTYAEPSQIVAAETGNRLSATSLPGDPAAGPYSGGLPATTRTAT